MTPHEADNAQQWEGMDGANAFNLIQRHADGWDDAREMMEAWLRANAIPAGYAMVPVEPTEAMLDCVAGTEWRNLSPCKQAAEVAAYSAMLAAAPKP